VKSALSPIAAVVLAAVAPGCSIPPVQSGINPVNGCELDTDCPDGYHCQAGACQLLPRTCVITAQCDPGQSCQTPAAGGTGNCLPANRGFCEACGTTPDCAAGGLCVSFSSGQQFCSTSCGASCTAVNGSCQNVTTDDGDAGFTCLPAGGGCSDAGTVPATFSFINANIFQGEGCTVCHSAGAGVSFGSLDLVTDPYTALVGDGGGACANNILGDFAGPGADATSAACNSYLLLVDPGNYTASMLYIKLGLTQTSALYGEPMPTTAPGETPQSLLDAVQAWIGAGAPND
jgi:hypothetical protein